MRLIFESLELAKALDASRRSPEEETRRKALLSEARALSQTLVIRPAPPARPLISAHD